MLDKEKVKQFRNEINNVLEKYGEEKGIQIHLGSIRFDDNSFTGKLKVVLAENKTKAEQMEWNKNCDLFNLKKEDYGKIISLRGNKYKIIGLKPKSRKYPLLVERINNSRKYGFQLNEEVRTKIEECKDDELAK
jgi:hypothetical protein